MYKIVIATSKKPYQIRDIVETIRLVLYEFEHHLAKYDPKSAEYKLALQTLRGHNVLYDKFKRCKSYHFNIKEYVKELKEQFKDSGIQYPVSLIHIGTDTEYQYYVTHQNVGWSSRQLSSNEHSEIINQIRERLGKMDKKES